MIGSHRQCRKNYVIMIFHLSSGHCKYSSAESLGVTVPVLPQPSMMQRQYTLHCLLNLCSCIQQQKKAMPSALQGHEQLRFHVEQEDPRLQVHNLPGEQMV